MRLWIGNIAPGTGDDELVEFLKKYYPQLELAGIQRVEGDGSRPGAILTFSNAALGVLEQASLRLHGMHWKGRELVVQTIR